jgi:hypothetical protein
MSREPFSAVIARVLDAQPDIFLQNHEGYYRHRDVSELVQQLLAHREKLQNLLSDDYGTANARAEARTLLDGWNA